MQVLIRDYSDNKNVIIRIVNMLNKMGAESVFWGGSDSHAIISSQEQYSYEDIVRSVDAAIIVLGGNRRRNTRGDELVFSDGEKYLFYECGVISGILTLEKCCIVLTNEKVLSPYRLTNYKKIYLDHATTQEDLYNWIKNVKSKINSDSKRSSRKIPYLVPIETAFSHIIDEQKKFKHVRVFALSTIKSATLLLKSSIKIEKATILLREFTIVDEFLQPSMEDSINESIELWEKIHESGSINNLELLRFDFHPTTGLYIFDEQYVVVGNVYFDVRKEEYSFDNKEVLLIDSTSDIGKQYINKCISFFDRLIEIYS